MKERYYSYISPNLKAAAFDVMDYFSVNRKEFLGLSFTEAFTKLYEECKAIGLPEDTLSNAVDTCLTLEQRRCLSLVGVGEYHWGINDGLQEGV